MAMALVCHCEAVRERTIVKAIRAGASTVDDVTRACGAGGGCGGCRPAIEQLIDCHACLDPVVALAS